MKEKEFVCDVNEPTKDLQTLYSEYATYTKMESDLKKRKAEIKKDLEEYFEQGEQDNLGNVWLNAGEGMFKKEVRKKIVINPIFADPILKRLNLYDEVVTFEPVYDLEVIKSYIADGTITDDLVEKMFTTEVSYAIRTQEAKVQEEEEEA